MKFFVFSEYGEISDLAAHLHLTEGHDVRLYITDQRYRRIADGIVPKTTEWWEFMGKDWVWVFDSCSFGKLQDYLREQGESVVGGCAAGDELENDRQLGQDWFKAARFDQPTSQNFTDFEDAIAFVEENRDTLWIMKQCADAPKHLSHKGHFPGSEDMLWHLREMKKSWSESEFGPVNFDLMEVVDGLEIAASAFWNGEDWLRNSRGKAVGFLNFEEKKSGNGDTGETCGEMGTTFVGVDEDDDWFSSILMRPAIAEKLREIGFRGVYDCNCIMAKDGRLVALEPTMRFGVPATCYDL